MRFGDYKWRPLDELPPPPKGQPDRLGAAIYAQRLAHHPVHDALLDALTYLNGLAPLRSRAP